jgi:hypothetical protein
MTAINATVSEKSKSLPGRVAINIDYYATRAKDYETRHKMAGNPQPTPPDYYLGYGDKYVRRFNQVLRPKLSTTGQAWIDLTSFLLQWQMEHQCRTDPEKFARLEENPAAFKQFAYATHAEAYIRAGIAELPFKELCLIALTPDLCDLLTQAGLCQAFKVVGHIIKARWTKMITFLYSPISKPSSSLVQ